MTAVQVENIPSCVIRALDKVCIELNFATQHRYNFERGSADGDGIIGVLARVYIVGYRNGIPDRLSLICKYQPNDKILRDKFKTAELFAREVFVYTRVLPEFEKIQSEFGISCDDGFFAYPKCYHASDDPDNSILILEDLVARNFIMDPSVKVYSHEFARLVYTQLGRLHALSFVVRVHKPELFDTFKKMDDLLHKVMTTESLRSFCQKSIELIASILRPEEERLKQSILKYKNTLWEEMAAKILNGFVAEPYAVLNHADCWLNNLMCRYEKGIPTELIMIDYQHTRYCSPAIDLINFTFSRSAHEIRVHHFEYYIDIYYKSLSKLLRQFGCNPNDILPFDVLQTHLKRFGLIGFALATFTIPVNYGIDVHNLPDENSAEFQEFKFQMGRLVRDINKMGYFDDTVYK